MACPMQSGRLLVGGDAEAECSKKTKLPGQVTGHPRQRALLGEGPCRENHEAPWGAATE